MPDINKRVPALSTAEARKRGSKGGKASGEARRKKRSMREVTTQVLAAMIPVKGKIASQLKAMGFPETEANVQLLSLLAVAQKATKGDLQAIQFLRDTGGEKPVDKIQNDISGGNIKIVIEGLPDD